MPAPKPPIVLYLSTFPPRECGIATFTQDLTNAVEREYAPAVKPKILAINDNGTSIYNYDKRVALQLNEAEMDDYLVLAERVNRDPQIKLVNIQHEYGLFGGEWGNYLLPFLAIVKKPIIVTLHTVLPRPNKLLKKITCSIIDKASGVVVMTKHAAKLLHTNYHIDKKKPVFVIPHGVHHIAFPSKTQYKKKLGLANRTILSTFGMLNPDKGIEHAIAALPEVIKKYPDVLYLVLGATHPNIVKHQGEKYRNSLVRLVNKLKLNDHVKFYNKYLTLEELIDFLRATDIYVSPTMNPKQAVSGTISYALSCACPIVATANQYAIDVINRERGILVGFGKPLEIEKALLEILDDPKMLQEMKKASYYYSRHMTWQNVAMAYFQAYENFVKIIPRDQDKLPIINLDHLKKLTDSFGMIQFARHTKPDPHSGYCLDDNARALFGCARLNEQRDSKQLAALCQTYFDYLKFSQKSAGRFYDFVHYDRKFNDTSNSDDSFGRVIWALGSALSCQKLPPPLIGAIEKMFLTSNARIAELDSSRAWSFALLGLCPAFNYYQALGDLARSQKIKELIKITADKLLAKYQEQINLTKAEGAKWQWFDDHLTYSNYKIPEGLLRAYEILRDKNILRVAEESINFLSKITFDKGYYNAIGQDGWYFRNGKRAYFDQQPEDAASATEALVTAYEVTKKAHYLNQAKLAFAWFLGKNHLNQMIYDEATGGCYDGLGKESINFNQGAESTVSYFLARLAMERIYKKNSKFQITSSK